MKTKFFIMIKNNLGILLYLLIPLLGIIYFSDECYTSPIQLKAKYERCNDLGVSHNSWTFVCPNQEGDTYINFKERDGKFCKVSTEHL